MQRLLWIANYSANALTTHLRRGTVAAAVFNGCDVVTKVEPVEASANPAACWSAAEIPLRGAAGLASESKIGKIPYREDSLQLAAG